MKFIKSSYNRMELNMNKNQNIEDKKSLIIHTEKNENISNKNPLYKMINLKKMEKNNPFSSFKNIDSQYINNKRKRPAEEKNEGHALNEIENSKILKKNFSLMEHEIKERVKKKLKIKEEIQKISKRIR